MNGIHELHEGHERRCRRRDRGIAGAEAILDGGTSDDLLSAPCPERYLDIVPHEDVGETDDAALFINAVSGISARSMNIQ